MRVWRLTKRPHADLRGEGTRLHGGRWTSPGRPAIYTADSPSLALLEVLVHLDLTPDLLPADYVTMEIEVPDDAWRFSTTPLPADHADPRAAGDAWLVAGVESVLAVSSVIVPRQTNYLLNPLHPDATRFRIVMVADFVIDRRLL